MKTTTDSAGERSSNITLPVKALFTDANTAFYADVTHAQRLNDADA